MALGSVRGNASALFFGFGFGFGVLGGGRYCIYMYVVVHNATTQHNTAHSTAHSTAEHTNI
jgi:hypothetical protein